MILTLLDDAMAAGARQSETSKLLGLDERTVQRWRTADGGEDRRRGPNTAPRNKLTDAERAGLQTLLEGQEVRLQSP